MKHYGNSSGYGREDEHPRRLQGKVEEVRAGILDLEINRADYSSKRRTYPLVTELGSASTVTRTKSQLGESVAIIGAGRGKRSVQFNLRWGISVLGLARNGMIEGGSPSNRESACVVKCMGRTWEEIR